MEIAVTKEGEEDPEPAKWYYVIGLRWKTGGLKVDIFVDEQIGMPVYAMGEGNRAGAIL